MKAIVYIGTVLGIFMTVGMAQVPAPLLQWTFDSNSDGYTPNTGSSSGASLLSTNNPEPYTSPMRGPSGTPSDSVMNLTSSSSMGGEGGRSETFANLGSQLKSFSITGWYYNNSGSNGGNSAVLVASSLSYPSAFSLGFTSSSNTYNLALTVNGNTASTTSNSYAIQNGWTFFAVTYNGTSSVNNVLFYVGDTNTDSLTLAGEGTANSGTLMSPWGDGEVAIGGPIWSIDQTFDGYLDDIDIYGSATDASSVLTESELEVIQGEGITDSFSAMPEPSDIVLLSLGLITICYFKASSRRSFPKPSS